MICKRGTRTPCLDHSCCTHVPVVAIWYTEQELQAAAELIQAAPLASRQAAFAVLSGGSRTVPASWGAVYARPIPGENLRVAGTLRVNCLATERALSRPCAVAREIGARLNPHPGKVARRGSLTAMCIPGTLRTTWLVKLAIPSRPRADPRVAPRTSQRVLLMRLPSRPPPL